MKKFDNYISHLSVLEKAKQEDLENEFIISGIIDKFFIQFELGWKVLKEYLKYEGNDVARTGSPREILKEAFTVYEFMDEKAWLSMLKNRNNMARIYDAQEASRLVNTIIDEYIPEFQNMKINLRERYDCPVNLTIRRASQKEIELLTSTRILVLRAANRLGTDVDMSAVEQQSRNYYERSLADKSHTAYLVFDGEKVIGAGGISYYKVMPTYHNPTGEKAYIMNMYTDPDYRRNGIASRLLDLLVAEAEERGIAAISLEATDTGRPLYEKYGFVPMDHEMELPEHR